MIKEFIRNLFGIKESNNEPIMYVSKPKLENDKITHKLLIICGNDDKEYDIKGSYANTELLYNIILLVILKEDIKKVYVETLNNYDIILNFLSRVSFIKLSPMTANMVKIIKDMENMIKENQKINIQVD